MVGIFVYVKVLEYFERMVGFNFCGKILLSSDTNEMSSPKNTVKMYHRHETLSCMLIDVWLDYPHTRVRTRLAVHGTEPGNQSARVGGVCMFE